MRPNVFRSLCILLALLGPAAARAQHAPRIADGLEVGAEVRVGDEVVTLAGIGIAPLGPYTDVRGGFGIVSVEDADSDVFLTGGFRYLLGTRTPRFPLDSALDAELNLFFGDDTDVQLFFGPTLGGPIGTAGLLIAYVEPLLAVSTIGDDDLDVGVRFGADFGLSPTVDVRGDLLVSDDTELRGGVYFKL